MKNNGFISNLIDRITLAVMTLFSGKLRKKMIDEQYAVNKEAWRKYLSRRAAVKISGDASGDHDILAAADAESGRSGSAGLIEDQSELGGFAYGTNKGRIGKKLFNGKVMTGADNTCEVIAVYNVMYFLDGMRMQEYSDNVKNEGRKTVREEAGKNKTGTLNRHSDIPELPELLREFSRKGIAYRGMFGTAPKALGRYLRNSGYNVEELKASKIDRENCGRFGEKFKTFIFTTFNEGHNPFSMIHTMCITKEIKGGNTAGMQKPDSNDQQIRNILDDKNVDNSVFQIHNDYEGSKCYVSLYDAVTGYNGGKGHPIVLMGVGRSDEMTGDYKNQ